MSDKTPSIYDDSQELLKGTVQYKDISRDSQNQATSIQSSGKGTHEDTKNLVKTLHNEKLKW